MNSIALRTSLVTLVSVFASVAIGKIVIPAVGGAFDAIALIMCVVCPALIAFPVAFHAEFQKRRLWLVNARLSQAHAELNHTHAELACAHARLAERAQYDDMTGMLNRATFLASLERARLTNEAGALLMIDADNFKCINDGYGHAAGDSALREIAAAIRRAVPANDIVGRIGGEEFCVFLPAIDAAGAALIAERIRTEVEKVAFAPADGCRHRLTVSIGCTRHRAGMQLCQLMREADRRLYRAKSLGRNRVVFSDARTPLAEAS